MSKIIRLTEDDLTKIIKKVINEQKSSVINRIFNRVKNNPTFKKIQSLYNKDVSIFVRNVVNNFPKLKNKESELLNLVNQGLKNPETFITKYEGELDKQKIQEQAVILFSLGFFALWMIIAIILRGPKVQGCTTAQEPTDKLKNMIGKTVNIYNDENNDRLYGTVTIKSIKFQECSSSGGGTVVVETGLPLGRLDVNCLYNSQKLDPKMFSYTTDSKGRKYISSAKYNETFTNELSNLVSQYCVRPAADYAVNQNITNSNMV